MTRPTALFLSLALALPLALAVGCAGEDDSSARGQRGVGKADDLSGSCLGSCGGKSQSGSCYCDDACEGYGDCCEDYEPVCNSGMCGGLAGSTCDEGEFCAFPLSATCGWADATGTCQEIPEFCPEIYSPVCGCDGNTYDNECFANAAGTAIVSAGECQDQPPPPPEPEPTTSCAGSCGGASPDGCYCDELCEGYGDCCDDYADACVGRVPATGMCVRNSGDECETDSDCMAGGCGGEVCFNPDVSSGISTCDCTSPQNVGGCGCVNGSCSWYQ